VLKLEKNLSMDVFKHLKEYLMKNLKSALVLTAFVALAAACTKKDAAAPGTDAGAGAAATETTTTTTLPNTSGSSTEVAPEATTTGSGTNN